MLATAEAACVLAYALLTRLPAQKSACKDLSRNGQSPAITPEATCVLVYAHNALTGAETCV
ncbi:alpha-galactosidase [Lacticaseibacillus rhamnosus]|uniref:Alpha-galactosidase n=2 Tax=Lacticaseibacillus rhamnosus TaxID=47715 RepID=A0AB74ID72_LACRH|nr:ATP-dependent nuclease, subunit B [Lacticaseibacillus rhamnosus LOCK908]EEN79961.1 hypothetical protein HMPREF0539_1901 [Lacticaseibacillus rhamnosus LMS2-1]KRK32313.1 hypothetical protein Q777_GL000304 [Lacticaseibacillus rhamnosus DSM 20021 = JCM 1136 = NBRC 3425]MCT3148556.1 alpha-galactosidase [Lacticaseibacillus rhamnosus]CAR90668.1 Conserved protein [Lacticaseibacillus rhamnosus Lc 705]